MRQKIIFFIIIFFVLFSSIAYFRYFRQAGDKQSVNKPNILLVTVCSLRQDHLGCYGYQRNTSPNIDNLAKTATIFKNSYTHIPWTKPGTIALLTGRYPSPEVKVENNIALPSLLHSKGYFTCGIIGTNIVRDGANADIGFDIFLDHRNLTTSKDYNTVQADTIVDRALEILNNIKPGKQPVFLWLFFKDPHWPYLPPFSYREKFVNDLLYEREHQELNISAVRSNSIGGIGEARLMGKDGAFITDKAYYIAQYDSEILYMDSQFGRVVEYLKQKSNYEDWVVIVSSDHGESMTEDNCFFDHGYKLTEGLVRIPLIVKFPRQSKGDVVKRLGSICDVYSTILSLAGIYKDRQKDKSSAVRWHSDRVIMLENNPGIEIGNTKLFGLVWRSYKLIYDFTTNEKMLYDVSGGEARIKEPERSHKAKIDKMSKLINAFIYQADKEYFPGREELRSLGYLQ